jgi:hypothetical protein
MGAGDLMGKLGRAQHHGKSARNKRAKAVAERQLQRRIEEEKRPVKVSKLCTIPDCDGSCGDCHRF